MNHEQEKNLGIEEVIQDVTLIDDLSHLTQEQRWAYYQKVSEAYGLDPLTRPFSFIRFEDSGKLKLYALRSATDQLRKIHNISVSIVRQENFNGMVYMMTARAKDSDGRIDEAVGSVPLCDNYGNPLSPRQLSNAIMSCQTKAIRRATLSICGVSMLDETEVLDIPNTSTTPPNQIIPTQESATTADLTEMDTTSNKESVPTENLGSNPSTPPSNEWMSGLGLITSIQKIDGKDGKAPCHLLRIEEMLADGEIAQFEAYAVHQLSQMMDNRTFFELAEVKFKAQITKKGVLLHSLVLVDQPQMNI